MTDCHVPNAEATPGWKKHKFPRTKYLDAIKVIPVEGSNGSRYAGNVPVDWCSGGGGRGKLPANGGFLTTAIIFAAREFSRSQFSERDSHEVLTISIDFLQPVRQGPYHVELKVLHSGVSQSTIQAEIVPADPENTAKFCHATLRLGSFNRTSPIPVETIEQTRTMVPDRVKDCSRWVDAFFYYVNPATAAIRCYTPTGGPNPLWSPSFGGRNFRYMWSKLDDGQMYEQEHLPLIADLIPPIPLSYEENALEGILKYQIMTTSLKMDIRFDIKGYEWLLTKTQMRWLSNGRFDMNIEILDEDGRIVATCHQSMAVLPSSFPSSMDGAANPNSKL